MEICVLNWILLCMNMTSIWTFDMCIVFSVLVHIYILNALFDFGFYSWLCVLFYFDSAPFRIVSHMPSLSHIKVIPNISNMHIQIDLLQKSNARDDSWMICLFQTSKYFSFWAICAPAFGIPFDIISRE